MVGLLIPAVQSAREAARRMACSNNLRQIAIAMHNYHDQHSSFPPAYTVDASGNRLHSWRTLLLPYMEQQALYSQIDLDKPWDDPVNIKFSEVTVPTYTCMSNGGPSAETTYVAVVDPSAVMSGPVGTPIAQIVDGTSNTLLVVETDPSHAVNWMSPDDIDLPTYLNSGSVRHSHTGGSNTAMADGSVTFISQNTGAEVREKMVTMSAAD